MREEFDLEAAIAAGVIGEDQALAIRNMDASRSGISAASAEPIEIASGLADVMSAIGLGAVLVAVLSVVAQMPLLSFLVFPAMIWAGRRFTIERRMTLTAFVLFLAFEITVAGSAIALAMLISVGQPIVTPQVLTTFPAIVIVPALVTAATYLWWRTTRLPVAVAAGCVSALNFVTQVFRAIVPDVPTETVAWIHLGWGFALFAIAMWWDMSDIRRETIRSRVGFWCHAAAGFFLANGLLVILAGRSDSARGWQALYTSEPEAMTASAGVVFLAVCLFGAIVALLIDRRSFIFSTLFHVVAVTAMLTGHLMIALALVGGLLVALALSWRRLRSTLLALLPVAIAAQLPRTGLAAEGRRPTRRHQEMSPRRWEAIRRRSA